MSGQIIVNLYCMVTGYKTLNIVNTVTATRQLIHL